jgi:hypothetical protein
MVGDAASKAAISCLTRDSFVPTLFKRLKPVYGKTTFAGLVFGNADVWGTSLAAIIGGWELSGRTP